MLQLQNITKSFGGVQAIKGSTFTIASHTATALIGPNGAGKTTLFDIISGLVAPDAGSVYFDGKNLDNLSTHKRASLGMSRTFQQVRLFKHLTILDHLYMVDNAHAGFWKGVFKKSKVDTYAYEAVLTAYGIKRPLTTLVSDLSYGQRKLLQIALAVRRPHKLLMLDEPVAGVNSVIQEQIENLLLELKAKGETILLIDHDIGFVRRLSDHVVVLDAGTVIAEGTPEEVLNNPLVLEAYLGK